MPLPSPGEYEHFMRAALAEAEQAAADDEVPVGAVVVHDGVIIGQGHDEKMRRHDPTAHAEILAMRQAAAHLGDWRLEDCALFVTLEPCAMCAGATLLARVPLVVYGARSAKFGAIESAATVTDNPRWNHQVRTHGGVLESDCATVLKRYFATRRRTG